MNRRVAALIVSVLAFSVVSIGCSEAGNEEARLPSDHQAARLPANDQALDRKVRELESGMSIEDVRARLGEPLGEQIESDPEVEMLFYGRWELFFEDDSLDRRVKYVIERPIPDPRVIDQKQKALDRKVLALRLGMSMAAVRSTFGTPDTYTIFKNAPGKEEGLSYEGWELTFVDGVLTHRQKR